MKNIHITLTEFRNESRVLKEISSLEKSRVFDSFTVISLGADDLSKEEAINSKAKIQRVNLISRKLPKSPFFQMVKFIEFMFKSFLIIKKENPDVVNVHTLSLLPLGWLLKKTLNVKLVYDAHELETEKNGLHGVRQRISKWIEVKFIYFCDLIIVVGDNIADWYANTYNIQRPLVVKNSPRVILKSKDNLFRENLGILQEQKIILYQGGLVKGRGIELIIEAFEARIDTSVVVVFMGYGELEHLVKQAAEKNENIFYFPAVHPSIVLEYTASADIGISLIEPTCLSYYFCMPNKLFEYAMVGLPVIVSNMKEMADSVLGANFGTVLSNYSIEDINAAIDNLIKNNLSELSENARAFAKAHSWEQQEAVMIEGYLRILGR